MSALDQLEQMVAAAKAQADQLEQLKAAVEAMQAPGDLQAQIDAKVKECEQLRAVIQAEIDDEKVDTARLEQALAPIEAAPVPSVDQTPSADAQPAAPAQPAPDEPAPPAADAAPAAQP